MKQFIAFCSLSCLLIAVSQLFCSNPSNPYTDPKNAKVLPALVSSSGQQNDSIITDTVGKTFQIILVHQLIEMLDSAAVTISHDTANGIIDTSIKYQATSVPANDTLAISLSLLTPGTRLIRIIIYKQKGYIDVIDVKLVIYPKLSNSSHKPIFVTGKPELIYQINAGDLLNIPFKANDSTTNTINYKLKNVSLPRPSTIALKDSTIQCQSISSDSGSFSIVLNASNGTDSADVLISIVIGKVPTAPRLAIAGYSSGAVVHIKEGDTLHLSVNKTVAAGQTAIFLPVVIPPWADGKGTGGFDTVTGMFHYEPSMSVSMPLQNATYSLVKFIVRDSISPLLADTFIIDVLVEDSTISFKWSKTNDNITSHEGIQTSYNFSTFYSGDISQVTLSCSLGTIIGTNWYWTPGFDDAKNSPIVCALNAINKQQPSSIERLLLVITVADSNRIPIFTLSTNNLPDTIELAASYSCSLKYSDLDGDTCKAWVASASSALNILLQNGFVSWVAERGILAPGDTCSIRIGLTDKKDTVYLSWNMKAIPHMWRELPALDSGDSVFAMYDSSIIFKANGMDVKKSVNGGKTWTVFATMTCPVIQMIIKGTNIYVLTNCDIWSAHCKAYDINTKVINFNVDQTNVKAIMMDVAPDGRPILATYRVEKSDPNYNVIIDGGNVSEGSGIYDFHITQSGLAYAAGFKVTDMGTTALFRKTLGTTIAAWQVIAPVTGPFETDKKNGDTIFVLKNGLQKATDGAGTMAHFTQVSTISTLSPTSIAMISGKEGWIIASTGKPYYTNSSFDTIVLESIPPAAIFEGIFIAGDRKTAFAFGNGVLYR